MDINELRQFLVNAKKNTYASGGERQARLSPNGTKKYMFSENEFNYIDKYKGHEKFEGKEMVSKNNKNIWQMHYNGEGLSDKPSAEAIYSFLRKALKEIPKNKPFRGSKNLTDEKFKYINNVKGNIEKFSGNEKIFYEDKLVYKLFYNGKIINENIDLE